MTKIVYDISLVHSILKSRSRTAKLKQHHFTENRAFFLVEYWRLQWQKDKEIRVGGVNTFSHMQSIECVPVLLILASPSIFLFLSTLTLSASLSAHSIILCRAWWLIYECSIGGLGHEWLLDIHHTHHSHIHSLVKAMKGSFESGCWTDNAQLN